MRAKILTVVTALALALAACGTDDGAVGHHHGRAATDGHNSADVMFARMMIPHHEQAVEMSGLAPDRAASAEVQRLATDIASAQQPEIDEMTGWLREWGEPAAPDHDMGDHMDGMLSDDQLAALEKAAGEDFDRLFLTGMIQHHEGAVDMAESVIEDGEDPRVRELAEQIVTTQTAEITTMKKLLEAS